MMAQRLVLYLDATHLVAFRWRAGEVTECGRFSCDADGHAAFAGFLHRHRTSRFLMLCDLADEAFIAEMVPAVRGRDRAALVKRKLAQHFFGTPLNCARSLGRTSSGRRDERMLFCALTRPALLEPWLAALRAAEAALGGIHSVALASTPLLQRLRLMQGPALLLGISSAGVRQSFFDEGQLRFSRLTPLTALSSNDLPRACVEEARRLHPYLLGQRLVARNEPLKVRVLVSPGRMDAFAQACRATDMLQFELIDTHQAAGQLGLRPPPADPGCETLFVQSLMLRPSREQFAPPAERRFYRIWQARLTLGLAGGAVLAICVMLAAVSALDSLALHKDSEQMRSAASIAERTRADIIRRLPPTPVPLDTLRAVHERSQQIESRSAMPDELMRDLGAVLESFPQVQVQRLEWRIVPPASGAVADSASAELEMQAELPMTYRDEPRRAIELMDTLASELRARPNLRVRVTQQPFDLASGQVLRGGGRDERLGSDALPRFSLALSRTLTQ
jgi:hypothetical protein